MDDRNTFLDELRQDYPVMFSDENLREIECLSGWNRLIEGLCGVMQAHLKAHSDVPQVIVHRVKEKWGDLRFIFSGGDDFCRTAADMTQQQSLEICEVCGMPGELTGDRWVSVRCPMHEGL